MYARKESEKKGQERTLRNDAQRAPSRAQGWKPGFDFFPNPGECARLTPHGFGVTWVDHAAS